MALVRKILETTIPSGGSSATFNDSDIPNSLIRVYSTNSDAYPQNISLTGNTLTVTYETVTSALGVAVELVKQGLEIDDNLTSDNTDHALSAKQGKVLKGLVDAIPDDLSGLSDVEITDIEDGQVLAWNEVAEKFVNVNLSGGNIDYSNTEHVVGTWTDGSILYEKTIYISAPISGSYYSHSINNASNIIFIHDVFARRNNAWNAGIYYLGSGDNLTILVNESSTQGIYIQFNSQITNVYITIRYTKTS